MYILPQLNILPVTWLHRRSDLTKEQVYESDQI